MNKLILSLGNIFDIDSINQQINLTLEAAILVTLVSLGLGVFLSLIYLFTHRKNGFMQRHLRNLFPLTLLQLKQRLEV